MGDTDGRATPLSTAQILEGDKQCLETRCFVVKDLTRSGYGIIRTFPDLPPDEQSMLFVTGAAWSLAHKHVDDVSFVLFQNGRHVFVDTGTPGYNRDASRRYALGASAHNTVSLADFHIEPKHVQIGKTTLNSCQQGSDRLLDRRRCRPQHSISSTSQSHLRPRSIPNGARRTLRSLRAAVRK